MFNSERKNTTLVWELKTENQSECFRARNCAERFLFTTYLVLGVSETCIALLVLCKSHCTRAWAMGRTQSVRRGSAGLDFSQSKPSAAALMRQCHLTGEHMRRISAFR